MFDLQTEDEVAKQLHVSLGSLRRWRLEKRGPQFIKVGSLVRYRPEDIEIWLAGLPTGGANAGRRREVAIARVDRSPTAVRAAS